MEGPHADAILQCPYIKEKNITFSCVGTPIILEQSHDLLMYSQFHVDKVFATSTGFPLAEFDAEFNFWCSSMEDLIAVSSIWFCHEIY
jgi:hypothetical protein